MKAANQAKLVAHAREIAAILYDESDQEQVKTLAGIEETIRGHLLEHIGPEIASFLSKQAVVQVQAEHAILRASLES